MSGTCENTAMPKALSLPASQEAPKPSLPPPLGVQTGRCRWASYSLRRQHCSRDGPANWVESIQMEANVRCGE